MQDYGPGASYATWLEYFPRLELYYIEHDVDCVGVHADKFRSAHIYTGDQANRSFLDNFAAATTADGLFDLVVDDGGHTMEQQLAALEQLWPIVRPGGLYVIEDLQTSFLQHYGGQNPAEEGNGQTTMRYLFQVLQEMMTGTRSKKITHGLLSIDCMAEICTLQKKH